MARRADEPTPGVLLVDKPAGWTSHDVVARARRLLSTRKVGHAGTLDPMATGLLVLAVGRATRLLTYVTGHDKSYDATIRLGQTTVTDDAEGEVTASADASGLGEDEVREAIARLTGDIMQVPSAVSAIKVDGKRSYARVRGGEDVELAARPVTVSRFEAQALRHATAADGTPVLEVDVTVDVSSGTYVRALARDLGADLGVGGHLTALRRTRVGGLHLADAHTLDALGARADAGEPMPLTPLAEAAAAAMPVCAVAEREAISLGYGQWIKEGADRVVAAGGPDDATHDAVAIAPDGRAVAIVRRLPAGLKPVVVFAPAGSAP